MGSRPGGIGGHNLQSTAGTLLTTSVGKKKSILKFMDLVMKNMGMFLKWALN